MKKKNFILLCGSAIGIVICFVLFNAYKIANPIETIPLPEMYGEKNVGLGYEGNFKVKKDELDAHTGSVKHRNSIDIDLSSLRNMLNDFKALADYDSIHLYLATNDKKQLTIVFVPADSKNHEYPNTYYGLRDDGTLQNDLVYRTWIDNYQSNELKWLYSTIAKTPDDVDPATHLYSDTKTMYYSRKMFEDLVNEIDNQSSYNQITISGLRVFFAVYPSTQPKYKNRLFVVYEYTETKNNRQNVLYLEDTPYFQERSKLTVESYLDNGQLCPTYCP